MHSRNEVTPILSKLNSILNGLLIASWILGWPFAASSLLKDVKRAFTSEPWMIGLAIPLLMFIVVGTIVWAIAVMLVITIITRLTILLPFEFSMMAYKSDGVNAGVIFLWFMAVSWPIAMFGKLYQTLYVNKFNGAGAITLCSIVLSTISCSVIWFIVGDKFWSF